MSPRRVPIWIQRAVRFGPRWGLQGGLSCPGPRWGFQAGFVPPLELGIIAFITFIAIVV